MVSLPDDLHYLFRPASRSEILSWSFGVIRYLRPNIGSEWIYTRNTLNDEAIFGPKESYHCVCGFFNNFERTSDYSDLLICPTCGVKFTTSNARRERFGHIELYTVAQHPLGNEGDVLDVIPVLPAMYWDTHVGMQLANSYEITLTSVEAKDQHRIQTSFEYILDNLIPQFVTAYRKSHPDVVAIAKGMALVRKEGVGTRKENKEKGTA